MAPGVGTEAPDNRPTQGWKCQAYRARSDQSLPVLPLTLLSSQPCVCVFTPQVKVLKVQPTILAKR